MQPEETVSSQRMFDGRLIGVRVDTVRLPDGSERRREVAEHPGAVAILPVLPGGELVLIRQYRHAVGRPLLEVPAGTREPDESTEACARRELAEETGYRGGRVRELVRFYVSPGWANEELVTYVATDLEPGSARPEDDERLGFGLARGALASSIAHDAHNIVAVGADDGDILLAIEAVVRMRGGLAVAAGGALVEAMALPVAGILSPLPLEEAAAAYERLEEAARRLGSTVPAPFGLLSFMTLSVIPEVRVTDRGVVVVG